jgi:hypothetical protein
VEVIKMRLFKKKVNIGRLAEDREKNVFSIAECHSGFVWLRGDRGLKQIGKSELKFYKEKKSRRN